MRYELHSVDNDKITKRFHILGPVYNNTTGVDSLNRKFNFTEISFDSSIYLKIFGEGSFWFKLQLLGFGIMVTWRVKG